MKYNECDRITHITDTEGNTTRICYDKAGNMTKVIAPKQYAEKGETGRDMHLNIMQWTNL